MSSSHHFTTFRGGFGPGGENTDCANAAVVFGDEVAEAKIWVVTTATMLSGLLARATAVRGGKRSALIPRESRPKTG